MIERDSHFPEVATVATVASVAPVAPLTATIPLSTVGSAVANGASGSHSGFRWGSRWGSLWELWYHQASDDQRQQVLKLAQTQGCLQFEQLPEPQLYDQVDQPTQTTPHDQFCCFSVKGCGHRLLISSVLSDKQHADSAVEKVSVLRFSENTLEFLDPNLDGFQKRAVAGAMATPDVFLIQGYPGTGKSRVITEILRQAVRRGERVLFLSPQSAAVDTALARLPQDPSLGVVRLSPSTSPTSTTSGEAEDLNASVAKQARRFTLAGRLEHFETYTLQVARQTEARTQTVINSGTTADSHWAQLRDLVKRAEELEHRGQVLQKDLNQLASRLDAELTELPELATGTAGKAPTGFQNRAAALRRTLESRKADLGKRREQAQIEQSRLEQEWAQLTQERDQLAPMAEAKTHSRWWTGAYWRALLQSNLVPRVDHLLQQCQHLEQVRTQNQATLESLETEHKQVEQEAQQALEQLRADEIVRRSAELESRQKSLKEERGQISEDWALTCRKVALNKHGLAPTHVSQDVWDCRAEVLEAAHAAWEGYLAQQREQANLASRWVAILEKEKHLIPARIARSARVVAVPLSVWKVSQATLGPSADPLLGPEGVLAEEFDLLLVDESQLLSETDLLALSRRARRLVLVGQPTCDPSSLGLQPSASDSNSNTRRGRSGATPPAPPVPFGRLWSRLHADPRQLPSGWSLGEGKLICRLRPVPAEFADTVESEFLEDRPDIELRIAAPPDQDPYLAEVLFPEGTPLPEAKEYIHRELQELTPCAAGLAMRWCEYADHIVLELGGFPLPQTQNLVSVTLEPGLRELVVPVPSPVPPEVPGWQTGGLDFERSAGWDRERAEKWVADRLGLRDLGRTAWLNILHRSRPALGKFLADLMSALPPLANGRTFGRLVLQPAGPVGHQEGYRAEFVAVPPLHEPRRSNERDGRWNRGGTALARGTQRLRPLKGGAGLEVDLGSTNASSSAHSASAGSSRQAGGVPAADTSLIDKWLAELRELRQALPTQGLVNLPEAHAVIATLESMVGEHEFQTACQGWLRYHADPVVAVIALYPAQAKLLELLVARSSVLGPWRERIQIGVPSTFQQRECLVALVSLTRSHTNRAVSFGESPQELLVALTRAVARLILFGDPGTLYRRSQWSNPVDHLDEANSRREETLIAELVDYLQGHGTHPRLFRMQEGAPGV